MIGKWVFLTMFCVLLIGACDDDDTGDDRVSMADLDSLVGRYAQFNVVTYLDMISGDDQVIVTYGFATITRQGEDLTLDEEYCSAEHLTTMPVVSRVSDEATASIVPTLANLEVSRNEDGALVVNRPATPTPVGIRLEDPNMPLPDDTEDPRIWDQDGDGFPGVTVHISVNPGPDEAPLGDIYIIRREIFAYELTLVDSGELQGYITDGSEQLVVGASDPILLAESVWEQNTDLSRSPLTFVPVSADYDCETLMANRDTLLPPSPVL